MVLDLKNIDMIQDKITLQRIETLHPAVKTEVLKMYEEICTVLEGKDSLCRFAYTLRTFKEQDELYALGRTKLYDKNGKRLGKVTNAKGGQSFHNYGLAFDIVLLVNKDNKPGLESASWDIKTDFDKDGKSDWVEVVNVAKKYGWEWGGDWKSFKDYPHFQKTFGKTTKELQALYKAGKFIPGTSYVQL